MKKSFVLKGDICYSKSETSFATIKNGYIVCENGVSKGAFEQLPSDYKDFELVDYSGKLIIPGLIDLHIHAPQFTFHALGMDLELIQWLNTHTFPEESKYKDLSYAKKAYGQFVEELKKGPNTRSCIFATLHVEATKLLMDMLEESGQVSMVGKVNMDRNSHPDLQETTEESASATVEWLKDTAGKYANTTPILTPRFIPSCTDDLMRKLSNIQREYKIPVQSHLSENQGEISWVQDLCPESKTYGDAYNQLGMFGNDGAPTVMAHCVWSNEEETALIKENGVFVAHCPQSNVNLSSGIAPIRHFMKEGLNIGLGSDVAGGVHSSIFRAMTDAIQVSKLYWRLVNQDDAPLTLEEAFYLATIGGGKFFGKVGSFEADYEFDAVVIDDSTILPQVDLDIKDRIARAAYLSDDRHINAKYVRGTKLA